MHLKNGPLSPAMAIMYWRMTKRSRAELLLEALGLEEESSVPTRTWNDLLRLADECQAIHNFNWEDLEFEEEIAETVLIKPKYSKPGCGK